MPRHDADPGTVSLDAPGSEPTAGALPGTRLGRYEIRELLGSGGMGAVYRAFDAELSRDLAIKLVLPRRASRRAQERLLREAKALAQIRHPNVVPIYDALELSGQVGLVMPYLGGGTLRAWLRAAPRTWREVVDRFLSAGRGLAAAHAAGMVHRDFKPDNVLVGEDGSIQVADFGLVRSSEESEPTEIQGTPGYMPPEQLGGQAVDARADQYAFAVSVWEGLAGAKPPAALGAIPRRLERALRRALSPDPALRWPSLQALLGELHASRRRRARWLGLAVPAVGIAAGLAAFAVREPLSSPGPGPAVLKRVTARGTVRAAAMTPDGKRMVIAEPDGLFVRDLDGTPERFVPVSGVQAAGLFAVPVIPPSGTRAIVTRRQAGRERPVLVDLVTGAVSPPFPESAAGRYAFLDEDRLVVIDADTRGPTTLAIHDVRALAEPIRRCPLPIEVTYLVEPIVSRGQIWVVAKTGEQRFFVRMEADCSQAVAWEAPTMIRGLSTRAPHPEGGIVVVAMDEGRPRLEWVRSPTERIPLASFDVPEAAYSMFGPDRDGRYYLVGGASRWSIDRMPPAGPLSRVTAGKQFAMFALDAPRDRLARVQLGMPTPAQPHGGATLAILSLDQARAEPRIVVDQDPRLSAIAWSPDGKTLVSAHHDGFFVVDVASPAIVQASKDNWRDAVFTGPRRLFGHKSDGWAGWLDLDLTQARALDLPGGGKLGGLAASPETGEVAFSVEAAEGGFALWIAAEGAPPRRVRPDLVDGAAYAFTPEGDLLYTHMDSSAVERLPRGESTWVPWGTLPTTPDKAIVREMWVTRTGELLVQLAWAERDVYLVPTGR